MKNKTRNVISIDLENRTLQIAERLASVLESEESKLIEEPKPIIKKDEKITEEFLDGISDI